MTNAIQAVKRARTEIEGARGALCGATPDCGLTHLEAALERLEKLRAALDGVSPANRAELLEEVRGLRGDLTRAGILLEAEAEFRFGWARMLAKAFSGYTASGETAEPSTAGWISVQG